MIRTYQITDRDAVLKLLELNTPKYFDPSETKEFVEYLNEELEDYFVVELAGQIVGCGGINYFPDTQAAYISWDILHPEFQGRGIGKQLVQYRIKIMKSKSNIEKAIVRTSQLVYPFYEKCGFQLVKVEKDFWAKGFDLYLMEMGLSR